MERKTKNPMINVGPGSNPEPNEHNPPGDFTMIIVMLAVLAIILLFCFWGAPGVRAFCRRKICCRCPMDEPRESSGTPRDDRSTTPTIILLPFGRMLVVDRTVISQLQADQTGIDFMELSANLIRAHHLRCGSTPSILDSETTSKGLSPISLGFSPPSYDDICGEKTNDLPPSYSELSLLFRQRQLESSEMQSFNIGSLTARNIAAIQETILDVNENEEEVCDANTNEGHENEVRTGETEEESKPSVENQISVPSNLRVDDLPRVMNSISANFSEEDNSYPNCKYCIMSFENERKAKIKCYCYEKSTDSNTCALGRSYNDQPCSSTNESAQRLADSAENVTDRATVSSATVRNSNSSNESLNVKKCSSKCDLEYRNQENDDRFKRRSCEDIKESRL